ncbi:MAG: arylsulfatase [Rhodocyclaceae bacterium]|nr:arylsulfatase [Rhodocyclaceae bacterium]
MKFETKQTDIAATFLLSLAFVFAALPALAQSITGTLGAPSATITLDGKQLPPAPLPFGGVIKESALESRQWWPPRVVPPKGAPNILLIMTDDQGYGVSGTFGGVIPTPGLDRIAKAGLRYTQFHSTALCSPTRAALITGRNHHSVGSGVIGELSTGFPGYDSVIGVQNATIGNILKNNGYATSWFGKNHNTPTYQYSAAGPFDQWPSGMGFQYFYGFMGGETDQWAPYLFRDHTQVFPWIGRKDYNLTTDMADEAIKHMRDLNAAAPDQPFFVYYVPGGTHSPHQPKAEWREKFKGKFSMGYEKLREVIFANQKKLGVIPADTQLTPWPDSIPKWDSLSLPYKKLFERQAENFAGYAAYTDDEINRVIQSVEDMGKLDNTLIIYIVGDNGTSPEGTLTGAYNQLTAYNGILKAPEALQLLHLEDWGTDKTYPHMSVGWTWAFNTPFKWTKQVASHFGGTRQGLAISWPGHIKDVGGIRNQFHHVIDIVPTLLEATGIKAPQTVNGIAQRPIEGVSMVYSFDQANAKAPSTHTTQYFEMAGNRGIYHDGWIANTTPFAPPWDLATGKLPDVTSGYKWELYNITKDYSQNNDLAATNPAKLKEMQALFLTEAAKYNVLPLDNTAFSRLLTPRPSAVAGKTLFTYTGPNTGIPVGNAPEIMDKDYTITADITVPRGGAEGMIVTFGGRFGGYAMFLQKGKPVFVYNMLDLERFRWEGGIGGVLGDDVFGKALTPGKHTLVFDFKYDGPGPGKGGTGVFTVDGKTLAKKTIAHSIPLLMSIDETLDIGSDTRSGVDDSYKLPFTFTGSINKLTFKLGPSQMTAAQQKTASEAIAKAKD